MSSYSCKQSSSNDKNNSVSPNQSKRSKSNALKKALKAELRERASLVIDKNSAKKATSTKKTKEHGSSRALEDGTRLSTENQQADHYIDALKSTGEGKLDENDGMRPTKTKQYSSIVKTNRFVSQSSSTMLDDQLCQRISENETRTNKEPVDMKPSNNDDLENPTMETTVSGSFGATAESRCRVGRAPTDASQRASYSKSEESSCPTPCKKYGETPIQKRTVALDPVGIKIGHLLAMMKSPTNPVATSTMSRHTSAPTLEKNLPPTPAKKHANYPIKEKQKQYCLEPVSEISTTTSNNLCANYMTKENLPTSEATQRNHPASPALSPTISRAKEQMLETTHKTVKLSKESQFFRAKMGEFFARLGYRLGFGIAIAMIMVIATVLVTYLGFSHFENYVVDGLREAPIEPHLDEQNVCFTDVPNGFSPPGVHDPHQAEMSCRDNRKCPRRGRCYGGLLHDCIDGSDGKHGFNLFVPNEQGDACVPSVEAVERVKKVEGALLRLTAADACGHWRFPRDHDYPTFGLRAVVDEVNIDNQYVKPDFLPWLIPLLNSSRVIMEISSGLGDKNIGVMGLGPGVPPSELPLPFSCAARVKLSAWLRLCHHQLSAVYSGLWQSFLPCCISSCHQLLHFHEEQFNPIIDGAGVKFSFCIECITYILKNARSKLQELFTTIGDGIKAKIAYY